MIFFSNKDEIEEKNDSFFNISESVNNIFLFIIFYYRRTLLFLIMRELMIFLI